jgi:thiamine-phosphate pyrophosphorylase
MLDANLNRASEGIRAAEDVLRFVHSSGRLSGEARDLRHAIRRAVLEAFPVDRLVAARDSGRDPGRGRWRAGRGTTADLLFANLRRAQESARVLEEGLRLANRPAGVRAMQSARYRLYGLESASARLARRRRP